MGIGTWTGSILCGRSQNKTGFDAWYGIASSCSSMSHLETWHKQPFVHISMPAWAV